VVLLTRRHLPLDKIMKIDNHNLDDALFFALKDDLRAVEKARARKRSMPGHFIYIVALELGNCPSDLPKHDIKVPAATPPASFSERCDWEIQRQSFQFVREGQAIWIIAGGREGALYGFDELLECLTGVIWAGVRDDQILFGGPRPLPTGVQAPTFPYRFRDGSGPDGATESDYHIWLSRNRYNGRVVSGKAWDAFSPQRRAAFMATFRARAMHLVSGYHAMDFYLPESELEAHPEWRGMRDGKRVAKARVTLPECSHLDAELPIQPCYTNPEVLQAIITRMAAQIRQSPEIEIFSVWPHDGINNWCQCPSCRKQTPYEQMYGLALALAKRTAPILPIELIVYANMLTAPGTKLPKSNRIVTMLCPYLRPYERRFYEAGGPRLDMSTHYPEPDRVNPVDDRDYGKLFRAWAPVWKAAGTVPGIFEYGGILWPDETFRTERQRFLYHPSAAIRFDEAKWYRDHSVRYFYYCTQFMNWPDACQQLAMARSLWNADEEVEPFLDRYYSAACDSLGRAVRLALEAVDKRLVAREDPARELAKLETILAWLPENAIRERYTLWIGYVRLAWKGYEAFLDGKYGEALEHEQTVAAYLPDCLIKLLDSANTHAIMRYSETRQARLKMLMDGGKATDYKL
jgi:hypothetical protein